MEPPRELSRIAANNAGGPCRNWTPTTTPHRGVCLRRGVAGSGSRHQRVCPICPIEKARRQFCGAARSQRRLRGHWAARCLESWCRTANRTVMIAQRTPVHVPDRVRQRLRRVGARAERRIQKEAGRQLVAASSYRQPFSAFDASDATSELNTAWRLLENQFNRGGQRSASAPPKPLTASSIPLGSSFTRGR